MGKHRCEGILKISQYHDYQCTRAASVCRKGIMDEEWYCWQHDPDRIIEQELEKNH